MRVAFVPTFFAALASLSLASAAPADTLEKRSAAAVLARMNIVAGNLIQITATINTLQPNATTSFITVGNIGEQAIVLSQHVRDVIATANASAPFDNAGSAALVTACQYHYNLITKMTDAIVAHKTSWATAIFRVGDVSKTIHSALITEKNLVMGPGGFAEAVRAKMLPQYPVVEETMGPFFDNAIAQFKHCTGEVCLPELIPPMQAYEGLP